MVTWFRGPDVGGSSVDEYFQVVYCRVNFLREKREKKFVYPGERDLIRLIANGLVNVFIGE